jgi:hypothetical protein
MNYSTYIPDSSKWIQHFTSKSSNSKKKNGLILLNKSVQSGDGNRNIELINPDTALVERARASMKRKRAPPNKGKIKRRKIKGGRKKKKRKKKKTISKSSHSKKKSRKGKK